MTAVATESRLHRTFPSDNDAPGAARRAVVDYAPDLDQELRYRLALLVTELVTNSVVHGGDDAGTEVGLDVWRTAQQVHVTVLDTGPGFDPLADHNGYGLLIVNDLADRWGTRRGAGSSAVWFVLRSASRTRSVADAGRLVSRLMGRRRPTPVDPYAD